jgi:predicted dithiol-disulfide oxidoreductase (DUF899 family)
MSTETKKSLHEVRFPGESDQYRRAREDLLKAEIDLRRQIEVVAAQRRRLPLGGPAPHDYTFEEWDAGTNAVRPVRLSQLFEDGKESLFLYSHMFIPGKAGLPLEEGCPLCTAIIDAIDGAVPHITQRINFAVVAKPPIARFRAHAQARGWRHARLLSSANNTYNRDYQAEGPDGAQHAQATVFARRGGKIHHFWSSELYHVPSEPSQDPRHVDFMWPLWSVLDRTPEGRGTDWRPQLDYSLR